MPASKSHSDSPVPRIERRRRRALPVVACIGLSLCVHALGAVVLAPLAPSFLALDPPRAAVEPGVHSLSVTMVPARPAGADRPERSSERQPPTRTRPRVVDPAPSSYPAVVELPDAPRRRPMTIAPIQPFAPRALPSHEQRDAPAQENAASEPAREARRRAAPRDTPSRTPPRPDPAPANEKSAAPTPPSVPDDTGATEPATLVGTISPRYPALSRRLGEQGLVLLRVRVLASGEAGEIEVLRDSGHQRLVDAAIEAARQAEFTPARRGDTPVASWIEIPVRFVLE